MSLIRTVLFAMGGVLLGGVIHIAIILLMPSYTSRDAWSAMGRFGPDGEFHVLPLAEPQTQPFPFLDPHTALAVCRFSLDRPVRITAALTDDFWSVGLFDRRGRNVYSLNDRSAERSLLDLLVVTPEQVAQIRQSPPAALDEAILVELPITTGFVLLRVFVPDESHVAATSAALATADCSGNV
jgi:uncharacterized membrane protein